MELFEIKKSVNDRIDELEVALIDNFELYEMPVVHRFTPLLYCREIFMRAGLLVTSMIHNSTHQFIVSQGVFDVKINDGEWQRIVAPYHGITYPGTRRILAIHEDCVFTTCHVILESEQPKGDSEEEIKKAVDRIIDRITIYHENSVLGCEVRNNEILKSIENAT